MLELDHNSNNRHILLRATVVIIVLVLFFKKAKMLVLNPNFLNPTPGEWLQAEATEANQGRIDPQRTVTRRWVLTWKDSG